MADRDERGRFLPGSTPAKGHRNRQEHGGAAAIKALQHGETLTGLAAVSKCQVEADLEAHGVVYVLTEGATRLEATARLYWNAIASCAERAQADDKALKKLDSYVDRFVYLSNSAGRRWEKVLEAQREIDLAKRLAELEKLLDIEG